MEPRQVPLRRRLVRVTGGCNPLRWALDGHRLRSSGIRAVCFTECRRTQAGIIM
jgi:hypothetical protein